MADIEQELRVPSVAMDWVIKYHSAPIDKKTAAAVLSAIIPTALRHACTAGQRAMIEAADDNARKTLGDDIDDLWFTTLEIEKGAP